VTVSVTAAEVSVWANGLRAGKEQANLGQSVPGGGIHCVKLALRVSTGLAGHIFLNLLPQDRAIVSQPRSLQ